MVAVQFRGKGNINVFIDFGAEIVLAVAMPQVRTLLNSGRDSSELV